MKNCIKFYTLLLLSIFFISLEAQQPRFTMTTLGANNFLDEAWDLQYGPDDYLWVTDRQDGTITRLDPETGVKDELIKIPGVYSDSGQDGLLGIAVDPALLEGSPYVYASYTELVNNERAQKIVRYTYEVDGTDGSLSSPTILIEGLPASNDHNSGRLVLGPDGKLYYSIGDQGGNQNRNYCNPILSQVLPSQAEIDAMDWSNYPGKVLRLNPDGTIPDDNPVLAGVQSHIYSYGHRNAQGLVFGTNGLLYSDEHGPNTDDEVNLIQAGMNYGWPRVVGFKDDQAYDYCNWSSLSNCSDQEYENGTCPEGAEFLEESSLTDENYMEPMFAMFAVTDDYDYNNPACENAWICRPNVAPSSIDIYESDAIPEWKNSLLVVSLKRGRLYRLKLDENGDAIEGDTSHLFYTSNRYRDIAIHPEGKIIYVLTDDSGRTSTQSGLGIQGSLQNPGTILKFTLMEESSSVQSELRSMFSVWPNPATSQLNIDMDSDVSENVRATIVNASGQSVYNVGALKRGTNRVDISSLASGVYFLNITNGQITTTEKVVIYK